MRRMVFEVAMRCRTLSTAVLDPISRKSLGVQTPVEFIRSRICALRSSAGPRCGLVVCPIFVVTFRTDLMAMSLSEECIHCSDKSKITHVVLVRPATPQSEHRAWTLGHFPSAFETLSEERADLVESTVAKTVIKPC